MHGRANCILHRQFEGNGYLNVDLLHSASAIHVDSSPNVGGGGTDLGG